MATVSTVTRVYCPLPSTVTVTPSQYARVIIDDRDAGGAVNQVINSAQTFSVSAGGAFQIEAIGGDVTYTSTVSIQSPDGGVYAGSVAVEEVLATASDTTQILTGAGEYFHYRCTTAAGNITVYDNTSSAGKLIVPTTALAVGTYTVFGNANSLIVSNGIRVVLSGAATVYIGRLAY